MAAAAPMCVLTRTTADAVASSVAKVKVAPAEAVSLLCAAWIFLIDARTSALTSMWIIATAEDVETPVPVMLAVSMEAAKQPVRTHFVRSTEIKSASIQTQMLLTVAVVATYVTLARCAMVEPVVVQAGRWSVVVAVSTQTPMQPTAVAVTTPVQWAQLAPWGCVNAQVEPLHVVRNV